MRPIVLVFAACLILAGAPPEQRAEVATTRSADLTLGATVSVEGSSGDLNIEGWDEPGVEVAVTRYAFRPDTLRPDTPRDKERAERELKSITLVKSPNGDLSVSISHNLRAGGRLEYRIRVPRQSRLVVHHRVGDVTIRDVDGDIDATAKAGDILLQLPGSSPYTVDAHCRIGVVYSDLKSVSSAKGPPRKVFVRVGVGGIAIQESGPA